jgi:cation transporter-like permease
VERLFVIVVMYIGSLIFGILLAEVQQVVHQASQVLVLYGTMSKETSYRGERDLLCADF